MSNAPAKILGWEGFYHDSLATEILRSERRRVTILAGVFAFAACVYTIISFVPGILDLEFRLRFQARWPGFISLYGAVAAYEWALRAIIGRLIEHRRKPHVAVRYLNAFLETSIPTVLLFMAVSLMGPRDALGSPAFLFYFFFIMLSILRLDVGLCLFTGVVAAAEHFFFAYFMVGTLDLEAQASIWRTPVFISSRSLILFWVAWLPAWWRDKSGAKSSSRCARFKIGIERFGCSVNTSRRKSPKNCSISRSSSAVNYATSA
jgi:hypothetical protein